MPENAPSHFKERQAERTSASRRGHLRHQNWYNLEILIENVSTGGFMAECSEPVSIGSYVSLDVPGIGPVHAQVRWQLGARMGGMFLNPISQSQCEWIATRAETPEEVA
jgi:hypothetical protein